MKIEQPLSAEVLSLDLAFSSCIPLTVKDHIDEESRSLLTDVNTWRFTLAKWIYFVRENPQLTCPELVRTNNSLSLGLVSIIRTGTQMVGQSWDFAFAWVGSSLCRKS